VKRMSSQDAAFLYAETPTWHMHVASLALVDPTVSEGRFSFEAVRALVESRLALIPQLRWKLVDVPFGVDRPGWVEATDMDLDRHIIHIVLPSPDRFDDVVSDIVSTQLDRTRPLWRMHVIEGLADGRAAVVMKVHHALIDGVAAAGVAEVLLDITPEPRATSSDVVEPISASAPSAALLFVGGSLRTAVDMPRKFARFGVQSLRQGAAAASAFTRRQDATAIPYNAPRLHFNGEFTSRRVLARATLPMDRVLAIKDCINADIENQGSDGSDRVRPCTVNDVILALCSSALRGYLLEVDDLPGQSLVVQIPVSHRSAADRTAVGTKVGSMFAQLAVHLADPLARLQVVRASTTAGKELAAAIEAHTTIGVTEIVTPGFIGVAVRAITALHLERGPTPVNFVVSNVPGPPVRLYLCGAPVEGFYPMGPLLLGMGLNITLFRHDRQIDMGVFACPDLVPHPEKIADRFAEALDDLDAALSIS
jgi:diacylglycerol O-acyltransferase / wax synthase